MPTLFSPYKLKYFTPVLTSFFGVYYYIKKCVEKYVENLEAAGVVCYNNRVAESPFFEIFSTGTWIPPSVRFADSAPFRERVPVPHQTFFKIFMVLLYETIQLFPLNPDRVKEV